MTISDRKTPRVLTKEEVEQLLEAARASGTRDHLLVALPLEAGLRLHEIANLRAASIQGDELLVEGKTGQRWTPVSDWVARGLETLAQRGDVIWQNQRGEPMTVDGLNLVYRRLFDRAGISAPRRGASVLRHTFATRFIKAGGNVAPLRHIMGHARLETTMRFVDLTDQDTVEEHGKFSPLASLEFDPDWL